MSDPSLRTRWLTIALCASIFALGQFHRAAGSVFTPILSDRFALSATVISGLVSVMFLAAVLTQIPLGAALDRYGPRRMLFLSVLVIAAGTALFAIGSTYETLLVARIIIGFGSASLGASIHVIVALNFPRREFGYINGMVIMLGSSGGILGTYPLALALSRFDWIWVFGTAAAVTLVLAMVIVASVKPAPPPVQEPTGDLPSGYLGLLRMSEVRKILTISFVTFAPMTTITGLWGGPFLQDVLDFSAEASGVVLLVLFSGSVVAAFTFGQLDRLISRRKAMILTAAGTSSTCLLMLALLPSPSPSVSILLLFLIIFCQTFYIPLGAHMRKVVPIEMVGRASILLSFVGVAAIPVMQTSFGAILDLARSAGFETAEQFRFAFGAMGALMAACAVVYSRSRMADDS